ncbi:BtrH N-terminal domain-containing protein [Natrialbaceae archaeon AArc-T1-2]|uniref:BtrH N-terminal domain-containing protein n=1 Tax=Natrialbaceae archaeon AArc-T1-2 TaxID=3053904 RepID=UPI00255AC341|nr:BtrH N-terminal domain-containing protein [Natrialbaceae archaeon AArc-T1-2]WIV66623.1 BtrH N-terminal domain-containing protein [Natrialbaceae archaeon AArc-T1-2]
MEYVDGYTHQTGVHCGAASLRNVAAFYDWEYSEAACFGIGGGPAFVLYDQPDDPWVTFRTSPTWLVRAFFEHLDVPHRYGSGDDLETAWNELLGHVDDGDPVVVFLDPDALEYLSENERHVPPHVAVVVGYDENDGEGESEDCVSLSDPATTDRQELSRSTFAEAWHTDEVVDLEHEYLVVTRPTTGDETDAAAAGLRGAATYMVDPLAVKRDPRGPGEEGIPAVRSFATYLSAWPELHEPTDPVRAAVASIDEHGERAAYRDLFADALEELGTGTGLGPDVAGRMATIGDEWHRLADLLSDLLEAEEPEPAHFEEAATLVGDIADREEELFGEIADAL